MTNISKVVNTIVDILKQQREKDTRTAIDIENQERPLSSYGMEWW